MTAGGDPPGSAPVVFSIFTAVGFLLGGDPGGGPGDGPYVAAATDIVTVASGTGLAALASGAAAALAGSTATPWAVGSPGGGPGAAFAMDRRSSSAWKPLLTKDS